MKIGLGDFVISSSVIEKIDSYENQTNSENIIYLATKHRIFSQKLNAIFHYFSTKLYYPFMEFDLIFLKCDWKKFRSSELTWCTLKSIFAYSRFHSKNIFIRNFDLFLEDNNTISV